MDAVELILFPFRGTVEDETQSLPLKPQTSMRCDTLREYASFRMKKDERVVLSWWGGTVNAFKKFWHR
jgi:hypothetical protein